jgi:hypothetical protein
MRNIQRVEWFRFIVACGVMGGVTASKFFGWINRLVDLQIDEVWVNDFSYSAAVAWSCAREAKLGQKE